MSAVDYEVAASLGSATIHEAAGRIGALRADLLPANHQGSAAGPAFTVRCPDGDNLWLHRAIYAAAPGDVLRGHGRCRATMGILGRNHVGGRSGTTPRSPRSRRWEP